MKIFLREIRAIGLLVSMIIGAGIFALPYTVAKAGFFSSFFYFCFAAVVATLTHMWYARIYLLHSQNLRLPGHMRQHFGEKAYIISLCFRIMSYVGFLVAYGILAGFFLEHIIQGVSPWLLTMIYFLCSAPFLLFGLQDISRINLFLILPLIIFPFILFALAVPHMHFSSLAAESDLS